MLLSSFVFGQVAQKKLFEQFKNISPTDKEAVINKLISETGKDFTFSDKTVYKGRETLEYKNVNDASETLQIVIYSFMDGVEKWNIKSVSGKYITIFPLWKKYVNTNIDAEKILKEGKVQTPEDRSTELYKNSNFDNFWTLRF